MVSGIFPSTYHQGSVQKRTEKTPAPRHMRADDIATYHRSTVPTAPRPVSAVACAEMSECLQLIHKHTDRCQMCDFLAVRSNQTSRSMG